MKISHVYYVCFKFSNAHLKRFTMEVKTTNTDQTAPKGSQYLCVETLWVGGGGGDSLFAASWLWPRWLPYPYMVKPLKSSLEPVD